MENKTCIARGTLRNVIFRLYSFTRRIGVEENMSLNIFPIQTNPFCAAVLVIDR